MVTLADLKDLLSSRMEDNTIATKILDYLRTIEGKKPTARINAALEKIEPTARLRDHLSWKEIRWEEDGEQSLMLFYHSEPAEIDIQRILKHNARHFSALEERNRNRERLLNDERLLKDTVEAINAYNAAKVRISELMTYDVFHGEHHAISKRLCEELEV